MLVAVTGATGHIGANLVRALVARGDKVRALVHDDERALEGVPVEKVRADVLQAIVAALEPPRSTAWSACFTWRRGISIAYGDADEVHAVNVIGTGNVVAACESAKIKRLVHFL